MNDTTDFITQYQRQHEAIVKANALNKNAVFDALAAAGIATVTVTFNGEGDSGQIEEVTASGESGRVPDINVVFYLVKMGVSEPSPSQIPLSKAIEDLCYDYLSDEHGGWENNDGAYGEFIFDVATQQIDLDFNARFTDSAHYSHTF